MKELSRRFKDRPLTPQQTAAYWIEYVIRHNGATHLRTAALNMPLYQYLLLDVITFIVLVSISIFYLIYFSIKSTIKLVNSLIFKKKRKSD